MANKKQIPTKDSNQTQKEHKRINERFDRRQIRPESDEGRRPISPVRK